MQLLQESKSQDCIQSEQDPLLGRLASASMRQFEVETLIGPRKIFVKLKLNDIRKVEDVSGIVEVEVSVYLKWIDISIAGAAGTRLDFNSTPIQCRQLWRPNLEFSGAEAFEPLWPEDTVWNVSNLQTGEVKYSQKYKARIRNAHDFCMFPFDVRFIKVTINDQSNSKSSVELIPEQTSLLKEQYPLFALDHLICPEWELEDRYIISAEEGNSKYSRSQVSFQIVLKRRYRFYIYKVWMISTLLGVWSWLTFFVDPLNLAFRTSTALTLFLSLVAFLFVANSQVTKVSYLTVMDKLIVSNFIHLFFVGVESFFSFLLSNSAGKFYNLARPELSTWMDQTSCIIFPTLYLLFHTTIFVKSLRWRVTQIEDFFGGGKQTTKSVSKERSLNRWSFSGMYNGTSQLDYVLVSDKEQK